MVVFLSYAIFAGTLIYTLAKVIDTEGAQTVKRRAMIAAGALSGLVVLTSLVAPLGLSVYITSFYDSLKDIDSNIIFGIMFGIVAGKWIEASESSSAFREPRAKFHFLIGYTLAVAFIFITFLPEIKQLLKNTTNVSIPGLVSLSFGGGGQNAALNRQENSFTVQESRSSGGQAPDLWYFSAFKTSSMFTLDSDYRSIFGLPQLESKEPPRPLTQTLGICLQHYYNQSKSNDELRGLLQPVVVAVRALLRPPPTSDVPALKATVKNELIKVARQIQMRASHIPYSEDCEELKKHLGSYLVSGSRKAPSEFCKDGQTPDPFCIIFSDDSVLLDTRRNYLVVLLAGTLALSGEDHAAAFELADWLERFRKRQAGKKADGAAKDQKDKAAPISDKDDQSDFADGFRVQFYLQKALSTTRNSEFFLEQLREALMELKKHLQNSETTKYIFDEIQNGACNLSLLKPETLQIRRTALNLLQLYGHLLNNYAYNIAINTKHSELEPSENIKRIWQTSGMYSQLENFNIGCLFLENDEEKLIRDTFKVDSQDTLGVLSHHLAIFEMNRRQPDKPKALALLRLALAHYRRALDTLDPLEENFAKEWQASPLPAKLEPRFYSLKKELVESHNQRAESARIAIDR